MVSRQKIGPCSVLGCGKPALTAWLCPAHYKAKLRHGDATINKRSKPAKKCAVDGCEKLTIVDFCEIHRVRLPRGVRPFQGPCSVPGCGNVATPTGMCTRHSGRQKRSGSPIGRPMLSTADIAMIQRNPKQLSPQTLADLLGTTPTTVVAIQAGRNWGYLRT